VRKRKAEVGAVKKPHAPARYLVERCAWTAFVAVALSDGVFGYR
jgi:hypothetical protein